MSQDMYLTVPPGHVVFREGDDGTEMYIIESGAIDILRAAHGPEPLASLGPGDFFGEMAILEDQPRFATAVARAPTKLLRIDRAAFPGVIASNVEIAIRIMRKLAGRLRRAELRAVAPPRDEITAPVPVMTRDARASNFTVAMPSPPAPTLTPGPAPTKLVLLHRATGSRFVLAGHTEFLVGRPDPVTNTTPDIDLGPLDAQRSLSRRHAKLLRNGERWLVREEVGTLNGTFRNGQRLTPGVAVECMPGDVLRFGGIELLVQTEG